MALKKISVVIRGHATSISLEHEFLTELQKIAVSKPQSLAGLITEIDQKRSPDQNLSSALRVFVLESIKQNHTG